jgi:coenzyme F420-reducing hydrogenase gamma subunit
MPTRVLSRGVCAGQGTFHGLHRENVDSQMKRTATENARSVNGFLPVVSISTTTVAGPSD